MLYFIATPIGNLEDITFRAIRILKSVDYLLCEDTKTSSHLLHHYDIQVKLYSFHKFSEKKNEDKIIKDLKVGKNIGIISDGGTPLICDPGSSLLQRCIEEKISFTAIPGPCSVINGLLLSGMDSSLFSFFGFLPKKMEKKKRFLREMLYKEHTCLCFESPNRVLDTLKLLEELNPTCRVALVREMTKIYEEALRATPKELIEHFSQNPPRGEFLIALQGKELSLETTPIEEVIELVKKAFCLTTKEAIKLAAKISKRKKRDVYNSTL